MLGEDGVLGSLFTADLPTVIGTAGLLYPDQIAGKLEELAVAHGRTNIAGDGAPASGTAQDKRHIQDVLMAVQSRNQGQ